MLPPTPAPPSLEKFAYDAIKKAILTFALKPGDALVEAELSKQLSVSKTPIRDALSRLEKEGLVSKVAYTGTTVSEIDSQLVADLFELRAVLEGLAARKAALNFTPQDAAAAQTNLAEHKAALASGDLTRASELNRQFHALILRNAPSPRLHTFLGNLDDHLQRFRVLSNYQRGPHSKSVAEHQQILTAIQANDADGAEKAMRAHLMSVVADLKDVDIHALIQQISGENSAVHSSDRYHE
jgi:DNA-binding GntR family transcriptional regulator